MLRNPGLSKDSGILHCGNLTQRNSDGTFGPCHEKSGLGSGLQTCTGCQQGFHTYTVIIDRRDANDQQIRWYLDGRQFFSVSEVAGRAGGLDRGGRPRLLDPARRPRRRGVSEHSVRVHRA